MFLAISLNMWFGLSNDQPQYISLLRNKQIIDELLSGVLRSVLKIFVLQLVLPK